MQFRSYKARNGVKKALTNRSGGFATLMLGLCNTDLARVHLKACFDTAPYRALLRLVRGFDPIRQARCQ